MILADNMNTPNSLIKFYFKNRDTKWKRSRNLLSPEAYNKLLLYWLIEYFSFILSISKKSCYKK